MKNHKLIINFVILGIIFISMTAFVVISQAKDIQSLNPYANPNMGINDTIELYHNNMNEAFNEYIKKLMKGSPEDVNSKSYHIEPDGTKGAPFTAAECLDPANKANYSTFCVSVNLLGANSALCENEQTADDMEKFCKLRKGATALKGYLNFSAAIAEKSKQVFDTEKAKSDYRKLADNAYSTVTAVADLVKKQTIVADEMHFAKEALDQTLSAYDQLKVAWPMHEKYVGIYRSLETYRDKLVDLRHQTDNYPKKFIDITTTACK